MLNFEKLGKKFFYSKYILYIYNKKNKKDEKNSISKSTLRKNYT